MRATAYFRYTCILYLLIHLHRVDLSTLTPWTDQFPLEGVFDYFELLPYFIEISKFNANSLDPYQTPRSAASDLDLHCLPMSFL